MRWFWVVALAACAASPRKQGHAAYPGADTKPRPESPVERTVEPGTVVRIADGLVWIALEPRDTVLVGDTYQISRGPQHIGHVAITKVEGDVVGGAFRGSRAPPQPGDRARRYRPMEDTGNEERKNPPSHDGD